MAKTEMAYQLFLLLAEIGNVAQFAEEQGITTQGMHRRIKAGWKFGVLDGTRVMYNPKHIDKLKNQSR